MLFPRRIQHEINLLRTQLKHQSLEHIASNGDQEYQNRDRCYSPVDRRRSSNYRTEFPSNPVNDFHPMRRAGSVGTTDRNPYLEDELQGLLIRKRQLESRIGQLQRSREELTSQLDNLERGYSPYGRSDVSPTRMDSKNVSFRSYSTPTTPIHHCMID